MIDRLFTAVLAFSMLSVSAAAFASFAMEAPQASEAAVRQVQLERVVITAKRVAPVAVAQAEESVTKVQ